MIRPKGFVNLGFSGRAPSRAPKVKGKADMSRDSASIRHCFLTFIIGSLEAPRLDMPATKRFIAAGMHTRFVDMWGVMVTEEQRLLDVRNSKIDK
uniref:Uncharacterized protein n=1 Tax=Drosophila pseudoobscura pseudoobscura TaxID=46245 RepID=A0A0R3NWI9_DROPS